MDLFNHPVHYGLNDVMIPLRGVGPSIVPNLPTTPLGLVGHSWGAKAAAAVGSRGVVEAQAIASVAGTWDNPSDGLIKANLPSLMIAGTDDQEGAALNGLWSQLHPPKHQAMLKDVDHWGWFGFDGQIYPCGPHSTYSACVSGYKAARELLVGFMTKYLAGWWYFPPHLLGHGYNAATSCALQVRWEDPLVETSEKKVILGDWTGHVTW